MYFVLDMDYIGYHQLHTVHITIEMRYTYLEWSGGVANMPYRILLFTSTTCKSRGTSNVNAGMHWVGPRARSLQRPSRRSAQQIQAKYQEIKEVWADKMESMGKMPYPWLDWFVSWTSEATRRKIRSETQDVPFLNEERSAPDVGGIKM